MAAANTDKWRKKRSNFSTTLNGAIASGDTTINLNSTSGLPTDTAVTLTIDRVDSGGVSTPTKMERIVGVVSSNQIINGLRGVDNSPSAQAHSSGAVVEDIWDALSWNDAATSFLVEHSQSGLHNIPTSSFVGDYAVDGGSANVYSVTLIPTPTLTTGMKVRFKAANANTTVATLNVNALGAKAIKKLDGATALVANDIIAGQIVTCIYDGTNFQMQSPTAATFAPTASPTFTGTVTTPKQQGAASAAQFSQFVGEFDNGNSGASITIDWSKGDRQKLTVSAATTLTYSNAVAGQTLTLRVVENGTGNFAVTLPTSKWPGGSAGSFTTTPSAINLLIVYFDGTNYLSQLSAGFA